MKKNLISKFIILGICLAGIFSLCACGNANVIENNSDNNKVELSQEQRTKMLDEYQFALQQISFEHVYPDGTDCGFDSSFGFIEDNSFAIQDIDNDGIEELIIEFSTCCMAAMRETIYKYDFNTDTLKVIFDGYPLVTIYSNGVIANGWSHGTGFEDEDNWPYSLYVLNTQTGIYDIKFNVEIWVKSIVDNIDPEKFPKDIEGELCYIVRDSNNENKRVMSSAEYEKWSADFFYDGSIININYKSLNEQNIKAVAG